MQENLQIIFTVMSPEAGECEKRKPVCHGGGGILDGDDPLIGEKDR